MQRSSSHSVFLREPSLPRELSFFSSPSITPEISMGIAMYFARHPTELVFGSAPFFIHEMNTHVLGVLQSDVEAVGDGLCGIGSVYMYNQGCSSGLELALGSRIKTLARIRKSGHEGLGRLTVEQAVAMILALVSMEVRCPTIYSTFLSPAYDEQLIDTHYDPAESSLGALHSAAAAMIHHFVSAGVKLSSTAKYMTRALAREDMVMSLVYRRRNLIATSVWLDDECKASADRFMGFTMTLMPLLEELCGLAEDAAQQNDHPVLTDLDGSLGMDGAQTKLESRAEDLRTRLSLWRPPFIPTFSGPSSRKFLLHAAMYRTGALLYLHRLLHPHGSSPSHDKEACLIAYDVFAQLSPEARDNRLALFPIFLAACEFQKDEDRRMAEECSEAMYKSRNTYSTWVTGRFVKERVWRARDAGEDWGWMELVRRWGGECVPI